jgi:tricorn protease
VVFVAADDVWLAPVAGGRAWRFTTDEAQAATPRLTPDGTHVAWVSAEDGSPGIYAAGLADGTSTRLTYWGTWWARVSGWTPAGEVLAVSAANQPFAHYVRARVLSTALSGSPCPPVRRFLQSALASPRFLCSAAHRGSRGWLGAVAGQALLEQV